MWFPRTFCSQDETICIAVSIHLSTYLRACALGAKGKMNNAQIWVPEDLGGGRQRSVRLREGPPRLRQATASVCLIFILNVAHFSSTALVSEPRAGFWIPVLIRKTDAGALLRGGKIEIAFKLRKLGMNERAALSLKCMFILNSKCRAGSVLPGPALCAADPAGERPGPAAAS